MELKYKIEWQGAYGIWHRSVAFGGEYDYKEARTLSTYLPKANDQPYRVVPVEQEPSAVTATEVLKTQEAETQEPTPDAIEELKKQYYFLCQLVRARLGRETGNISEYNSGVITGLEIARENIVARLEELGVK